MNHDSQLVGPFLDRELGLAKYFESAQLYRAQLGQRHYSVQWSGMSRLELTRFASVSHNLQLISVGQRILYIQKIRKINYLWGNFFLIFFTLNMRYKATSISWKFGQDWFGHFRGDAARTSSHLAIPKASGFDKLMRTHYVCTLSESPTLRQLPPHFLFALYLVPPL